ncbi:LOW QUALITY PROTEIN: hypothetical protein CVT26_009698, partial [Gymnopilus dilepis]
PGLSVDVLDHDERTHQDLFVPLCAIQVSQLGTDGGSNPPDLFTLISSQAMLISYGMSHPFFQNSKRFVVNLPLSMSRLAASLFSHCPLEDQLADVIHVFVFIIQRTRQSLDENKRLSAQERTIQEALCSTSPTGRINLKTHNASTNDKFCRGARHSFWTLRSTPTSLCRQICSFHILEGRGGRGAHVRYQGPSSLSYDANHPSCRLLNSGLYPTQTLFYKLAILWST